MNKPVKQEFPSWRYHPTLPAIIIKNEFEEPDAEEGWRDVPYPTAPKVATGTVQSQNSTPAPPCQACAKKDADFEKKEAEFNNAWNGLKIKYAELEDRYALVLEELKNATVAKVGA